MHDNVLVLPDGGKGFMRTVKLAALYSEKVHVWSPTTEATLAFLRLPVEIAYPDQNEIEEELEEFLDDEDQDLLTKNPASRSLLVEAYQRAYCEHPAKRFLAQCEANRSDLDTLRQESVLVSVFEEFAASLGTLQTEGAAMLEDLRIAVGGVKRQILQPDQIPKSLFESLNESSIVALFAALMDGAMAFAISSGKKIPDELIESLGGNEFDVAAVGLYFWFAGYYATRLGCVGLTPDKDAQFVFDEVTAALCEAAGENPLVRKRQRIRAALGEQILLDSVPDVSRLPIDRILAFREKRAPELQAFRTSLDALAVDINLAIEEKDLKLAVNNQIVKVVRPKLSELRAALGAADRRATRDAFKADNSTTLGLVTFGITSMCGVPPAINAPLSAGLVAISKLVDWLVTRRAARKDALSASPWSVLFYLNDEV